MALRQRLLQRFFDLLYTRLAWSYDGVAWLVSGGHWYRWGHTALDLIESGPVLDLGCGRGRLLPPLQARFGPAIGLDLSPQMVERAAALSPTVLRGRAEQLPFADDSFGAVITTFPAPYILNPAVQAEIGRVLRPNALWIWVDGPELAPVPATGLARLIVRLTGGGGRGPLFPQAGGGAGDSAWEVTFHHRRVGPTTVRLRRARWRGGR